MYQADTRAGHRNPISCAARCSIESLEKRTMLTGLIQGVFDVNKVPVFNPTSGDVADVKHGPLAKSGGLVASVYSEYQSFVQHGGTSSGFVSALNKFVVI